jgi:hypothetical protein
MAGQADGDRTGHAVSGMRRAPDHDHHALAGAGIADAGRPSDQLLRDDPLAPLELPVRPAAAQHQLMPNSVAFWLFMQVGTIIGFATSWPANVWLVNRGIKVPM